MKTVSTIAMSFATLFAGAALAHTQLQATVPADAAMIAQAPANVELTFSEPVRLTALSIQKDGERKQSLGPLPSEATEAFSIPLPATTDDGFSRRPARTAVAGKINALSGRQRT